MNNQEGIKYLKDLIADALLPLIGKQCVLYDTPFYKNIGDVLIWQGELSFLEAKGIAVLDYADYHTYRKKEISKDVTVLFQGGGNIGDLYHEHTELLLSLIKNYPNNRIIVLSQTVYYQDPELFDRDFSLIAAHKDLYFCARDYQVLELIKPKLGDRAVVLPDMAFWVDQNYLNQWKRETSKHSLYIKRNDIEAGKSITTTGYTTVSDWPCFETKLMRSIIGNTLFDRLYKYLPFLRIMIREPWKKYSLNTFKQSMIKDGVEFISPFSEVTSERLHGCILAILLDKRVSVVNNSYGKNYNFYNSWLKDFENVMLLNP